MLECGERGAGALERLLRGFVESASWRQVMQPLLPLLPEAELLRCLTHALPATPAGGFLPRSRFSDVQCADC